MIVVIIKAMVKAIVEKVIKRLWNRFFRRSYPSNQYPPSQYQHRPKPPPSFYMREDDDTRVGMPVAQDVETLMEKESPEVLQKAKEEVDMMNNETYTCTAEERKFLDLMHNAYLDDVTADNTTASFTFTGFTMGQSGHRLVEALYAALNSKNDNS